MNNYITKLTPEQEKEFSNLLKGNSMKVRIRGAKLVKKFKEYGPGESLLESNERFKELENPITGSDLEKIIEALMEVSEETLLSWIEYEKELIKNTAKTVIQGIEKSEDIEMEEFLPFMDASAVSSINQDRKSVIQSINESKGIKIKGKFAPQIGISKTTSEEKKDEKITLPNNILEKTISFLKAKSIFINSRAETIQGLQELYNQWNNLEWKVQITSEASNTIGSFGNISLTLGIPNVLSDLIKSGSSLSKFRFVEKNNEESQIILKDDQEILELIEKSYQELYELVFNQ